MKRNEAGVLSIEERTRLRRAQAGLPPEPAQQEVKGLRVGKSCNERRIYRTVKNFHSWFEVWSGEGAVVGYGGGPELLFCIKGWAKADLPPGEIYLTSEKCRELAADLVRAAEELEKGDLEVQ